MLTNKTVDPASDIAIARAAGLRPIEEVAESIGIPAAALFRYGSYKGKVDLKFAFEAGAKERGKLILVTAISPTPAGEGKTTTTIGLGDALRRQGHKTAIALREPSLGPCFGSKGGATGGGHAQVAPMEEINLHFTGDFHAITAAHNLLAALIDNHIYWGNALDLDTRKITWRRVVDLNDRALRQIVTGLGGAANGGPRETGFDITAASEVMAIFCLANSLTDLETRLASIVIGQDRGAGGGWRHDSAAEGRAGAQPCANAGRHARLHPWRAFRQHRPWLQLSAGNANRPRPCRLRGDRGWFRRGSGSGKNSGY
jgi:formate--tetrahydrofolate ligase